MERKSFRINHWYDTTSEREVFTVQMLQINRFPKVCRWIDVKSISDEDPEYAKNCAKELLYYLEREE